MGMSWLISLFKAPEGARIKVLVAGLVVACVILALTCALYRRSPAQPEANPPISATVEIGGIRVSVGLPKSVFFPTEAIPCRIEFEDRRDLDPKPDLNLRRVSVLPFDVRGPVGNAQMTGLAMGFHRKGLVAKLSTISGQAVGFEFRNLAELCDMTVDGPYNVEVLVEIPLTSESSIICRISLPVPVVVRAPPQYTLIEGPVFLGPDECEGWGGPDHDAVTEDVQLRLRFPRDTFEAGEAVVCDLILLNQAKTSRLLPFNNSLGSHFTLSERPVLYDGKVGKEQVPRALGRQVLLAPLSERRMALRSFGPGQGYSLAIRGLNRLYDLTSNHWYEFQATAFLPAQDGGPDVKVQSRPVRIQITDTKKPLVRDIGASDPTVDTRPGGGSR